jgi:hypothetical protein
MDQITEAKLKAEIIYLEEQLDNKLTEFFLIRLRKMLGISEHGLKDNGVTSITINIGIDSWVIGYTHKTDQYNENNYNCGDESETETESKSKISKILFGHTDNYFLSGQNTHVGRFKIYTNSQKTLRVINSDYDIELDKDAQSELIRQYTENAAIPEWVALKIFTYMCDNKWDSDSIITHLSTV